MHTSYKSNDMGTGINNSYSINLNIGCPKKKNTLKIVLFTNKYIDLESNNISYYYYRTYNFVI